MSKEEFIDNIKKQIEVATENIIQENQSDFEDLVISLLKKGDKLFVANGTALLERGDNDNTSDDNLEEIAQFICEGVWNIGFDFQYKTTLHSETMYLHAKDIWNERVESSDLQKAWAIWVLTNMSFAGKIAGGWKWDNGSAGSHSSIMIRNKRLEFSKELHIRLSDAQISCRDAIRVILERDSPETIFYLDSPYPGTNLGHYLGYTHKNLFELLHVLSQIKGKFILSQYFTHTLKYHVMKYGWNFRTEELDLKLTHLGKSRTEKRTEILVYNFEIQKTLFSI